MKELKDEISRLHAENAAMQQGYDAARLEIDHLRGATKSKLLAQPVAWMVYLPSIDTQHLYYSQEDMGYVDDVTNHADAEVTPLYEMAAPKAEVAPAGEYPPLPAPAFQLIWDGGRALYKVSKPNIGSTEVFTSDQLRAYVDATCAMRAQAAPQREVFDEDGFRAWVIRNLPDNTIIGNSTWWADHLAAWVQRFMLAAPQPSPTPQADSAQDEPMQAFDSPRAKALMRAWEEGWAACRDAEYVGEEAQNDAFNSSHTLTLCIAEDQQLPAPQADSQPAPVRDYPPLPDFETVEQHIYGACRRYITQDMLEPIHNLIRDVIDADRAARAKAQAKAVPLTDEQIVGVMHSIPINAAPSHHIAFARAIEQAHGISIKNGGRHA